jgi:plasmid stabilization system protein ParE
MTEYVVRFSPKAVEDLQSAFDWGVENWGRDEASRWALKFETLIDKRISHTPMAYNVAPESENYPLEVRQLVVTRYRVLFHVEEGTVYVLRIRGPFSGQKLKIDSSDAP